MILCTADIHTIFKEKLRDYYLKRYCVIGVIPWDDRAQFDFSKLSMYTDDGKEKITFTYNDTGEVEIDAERWSQLLIYGEGGSGKSTLCRKLAYDWAANEANLHDETAPITIVLECDKISDTIANAVKEQLFAHNKTIFLAQVQILLESTRANITFVLDVQSELLNDVSQDIIENFLQSQSDTTNRIILTTRPSINTSLIGKAAAHFTKMRLAGFDSNGIESYVKMCTTNPTENIEKMEQNAIMRSYATTPILLGVICYVLEHSLGEITEIQTLGQLIDRFVWALFHVKEQQIRNCDSRNLPKKKFTFWNGLGRVAFSVLCEKRLPYYLTINDFNEDDNHVLITGLECGIICEQNSSPTCALGMTEPISINFPHDIIRDKCVADYLSENKDQLEKALTLISNARTALYWQYRLAFACLKKIKNKTSHVANATQILKKLVQIHEKKSDEILGVGKDAEAFYNEIEYPARSLFDLGLLITHEGQSHTLLNFFTQTFAEYSYTYSPG